MLESPEKDVSMAVDIQADILADILADISMDTSANMKPDSGIDDRGEDISRMEPILIGESSRHRTELADLALELAGLSAGFRRSLPEDILTGLAELVRSMNCYYSNLIEGHNTHPIDIERALQNDYSDNAEKRNLQLEARAHIAVQEWIDGGGLGRNAVTTAGICEMHRRFCDLLPEELLLAHNPDTGESIRMTGGELRRRDVKVGRLVPVSPGAVPRFLRRLEEACRRLGKVDMILAAATAHHRLLWIHPFLDGNGRVARLMSYALLLETLSMRHSVTRKRKRFHASKPGIRAVCGRWREGWPAARANTRGCSWRATCNGETTWTGGGI